MKESRTKNGLFVSVRRSPETAEERERMFADIASGSQTYLEEAQALVRRMLAAEGLDLDALLQFVCVPKDATTIDAVLAQPPSPPLTLEELVARAGDGARYGRRYNFLETELRVERPRAAHALEILELVWSSSGLTPEQREAFQLGVSLASSVEHALANDAWERPVRGFLNSRRRSAYRDRVRAEADKLKATGLKRGIASRVARKLQLEGVKISDRTVRDYLAE